MYVTGCREGVLAFWNPSGECIVRKQLFGRIQGIFVRENLLATAHFGKPFDAGCISIRQVNKPARFVSLTQSLYVLKRYSLAIEHAD